MTTMVLADKKFTVEIDTLTLIGNFKHNHYGDELAGRLFFHDKELRTYDGVAVLPTRVVTLLREAGFKVPSSFC